MNIHVKLQYVSIRKTENEQFNFVENSVGVEDKTCLPTCCSDLHTHFPPHYFTNYKKNPSMLNNSKTCYSWSSFAFSNATEKTLLELSFCRYILGCSKLVIRAVSNDYVYYQLISQLFYRKMGLIHKLIENS